MRLRVRVETTGSMVEVDVLPQLMVLAVKEIMALHTSIPVACQQLWWRGKLLSDSSVLKDVLPPMFFHASLDTITPEYYKLLLHHHHDDRNGNYNDGGGNNNNGGEGREGLEDLDRVEKEAFLTLKVVNPPTSTSASATLGLGFGSGRVRSTSAAATATAAVAAPASLRNLYLSQAAEGRRHVAAFGSSSEDDIDDDGDDGLSWQRFQEESEMHRDSRDNRQRRRQQKQQRPQQQQQQQQDYSSRGSHDGHRHRNKHNNNSNNRATVDGRTLSPSFGGVRSASGSGSDAGPRNVPSFTSPVEQWSIRETAGWLTSLGRAYHRYCHEFVESGIDGNMLLEICRDENAGRHYLKELGVKSIHSAKLFFEIRQRQRAAGGAFDAHTRDGQQGTSVALTQQHFNDRHSGMTSTPTGHRSLATINTPSRYFDLPLPS